MEQKRIGVGFGVMIFRDGKVLLGKRNEDVEKADSVFRVGGCWTMPGGKLKYGETFEDAAKREVDEETGIKINDMNVICLNCDVNEHAHFITLGFYSEDFSGEAQVLEPDEITEWKWFSLNSLPENIYFPSKKILENYKQKKFYLKQ